ncbi:MAG: RNA polymerase sigma factor [Phycisphaerales bacterium]
MPAYLQRISAGDESAVAGCVDEYGGLVWRLACRYLSRAPGEVEDAVQEIFVEVWRMAARFDPARGSEAAFIATIAHRRLIDHQRRLRTRFMPSLDAIGAEPGADTAASRSDNPPDCLREAVVRHDLSLVSEAFDRLPDDERHALWMSIHNGLSHRQIAEATRSPIGTVKTRLRRGLLRMYDLVAGVAATGHPDGSPRVPAEPGGGS